MLSREQKKEAIGKFKERKPSPGVYAVKCMASRQVWVGSSRNLSATRNGIWFSLRIQGHRDRLLQRAWDAHGESSFSYEVLEKLAEDVLPIEIPDLLAQKKARWIVELKANGLL